MLANNMRSKLCVEMLDEVPGLCIWYLDPLFVAVGAVLSSFLCATRALLCL